jgi:hypothetical protein
MNESDYLRQQLATERAHLRELLALPRRNAVQTPGEHYLAWATPRLLAVYERHRALLPRRLAATAVAPPLPGIDRISTGAGTDDAALAALLAAWDTQIEQPAAACYRIEDWRQVAQLRADDILTERRLYSAARAAHG